MSIVIQSESGDSPFVARIAINDKVVTARIAAKDTTFVRVVKSLGFQWNGSEWCREIGNRAGLPMHRAAELGRKLLENGFGVEFPDEEVANLATSGTYLPEQRKWVSAVIKGDYTGWIALQWGKQDDFYIQARRLRGSRYADKMVLVPTENFDEIEDFAEVHGFSISPKAQALLNAAREGRQSIRRVALQTPPRLPKINDNADEVAIPPHLMDDENDN